MKLFNLRGYCFVLSAIFLAIFAANTSLAAKTLQLNTIENAGKLKRGEGYFLVDLDVEGTAPSIDIVRLSIEPYNFNSALSKNKRVSSSKSISRTIPLKALNKGFYIASLPQGTYQVVKVNTPYFTLPYEMSTAQKRFWRFSIEKNKTNYVGKLRIAKQRSTNTIDVKLLNRLATNVLTQLDGLQPILSFAPLNAGGGVRDDFLTEWMPQQ